MYGVKITRRNGTARKAWEGQLVGMCCGGDWGFLEPFTVATLEEAEAKASEMQRSAEKYKGWDVRYLPCPLPSIQ